LCKRARRLMELATDYRCPCRSVTAGGLGAVKL